MCQWQVDLAKRNARFGLDWGGASLDVHDPNRHNAE